MAGAQLRKRNLFSLLIWARKIKHKCPQAAPGCAPVAPVRDHQRWPLPVATAPFWRLFQRAHHPRQFDSPWFPRLRTVRKLWKLRTVHYRGGLFLLAKSHLKLVTPTEVKRTVAPGRRPNAELRT